MTTPRDSDLLLRVAQGDQVALARLYDRHAGWVLVRLTRRCPDRGLVEEALQDTFLSVWRTAGAYRPGPAGRDGEDAGAGGWLWTLASRRLIDLMRRDIRRDLPVEDVLDAVAPGPEELLMAELSSGDMSGAMTRLAPDLRRVLEVTVVQGLSTREAAVALGIPEGTVKTRAARARRELRAGL